MLVNTPKVQGLCRSHTGSNLLPGGHKVIYNLVDILDGGREVRLAHAGEFSLQRAKRRDNVLAQPSHGRRWSVEVVERCKVFIE